MYANLVNFCFIYKAFYIISDRHHEEVFLGNLRRFHFRELQSATNNFSSKNIVGKGGECNGSADEPYSAGQFMGAPLSRPQVDNGLSLGNVMERSSGDLIWHGVISKGGNHVCHARCVPMGKGLEFEL